jgi:hypothetical protein
MNIKNCIMKQLLTLAIAAMLAAAAKGQKNTYATFSAFTTQTAMPFSKFAGLFKEVVHPGIEIGYGKSFKVKPRHDWYAELRLAYFFHRFVQHGIPVSVNAGYRYKINNRFYTETSIGAGYMHSVPAAAKLKLNENGDYENNKGIGRMQAHISFHLGTGYTLNPAAKKPFTVFAGYRQLIQMPFVKSYVPMLPYNSFVIGARKIIRKHHKI